MHYVAVFQSPRIFSFHFSLYNSLSAIGISNDYKIRYGLQKAS